MAAYTRTLVSSQLRSLLIFSRHEPLRPLFTRFNSNQCRSFMTKGSRRDDAGSSFFSVKYMLAAGFVTGGIYWAAREYSFRQAPIKSYEDTGPIIIKELPSYKPARQISIPTDETGLKLVLYQYPTCPFCCKVRAFLDYHGISYDVVEVDPVLRQQISWSKYKKVPILLAQLKDGTYLQLNDSSVIISALKTYLKNQKQSLTDIVKFYSRLLYDDEDGTVKFDIPNRYFIMLQDQKVTSSKETILDEVQWRKWADNKLVHVLSPNVYRTRDEALQSFEWFSEVGEWDRLFPSWERNLIVYVGAIAMYFIGKRLKSRHDLKDDVRTSLYDELNCWTRQINKKGTSFSGGNEPDLADLAVYGVLSSIEGCQAFKDALDNTNIGIWYQSMRTHVSSHSGSGAP